MATTDLQFRVSGDAAQLHGEFARLIDKYSDVGKASDALTQKTRKHSEETTAMGKTMANALHNVQSMLTVGGIVGGLAKAVELWKAMAEHAERVRDANARTAVEGIGVQRLVQAQAAQEGLGNNLGEAVRRAAQTAMESGGTLALASEARRAVSSAAGQGAVDRGIPGVIVSGIARTAGRGIDAAPDQAAATAEMLTRMPGAMDSKDAAAKAMDQIEEASYESFYRNIGEMATGMARGGMGGFLEGANPVKIMGRQVRARAVVQNQKQSERLMEQMNVALKKDSAKSIVEKETGKKYYDLSYDERFDAFLGAIEKRQGNMEEVDELLGEKGAQGGGSMRAEEKARIIKYATAPIGKEAEQRAMDRAAKGSAENYYRKQREAASSGPIQENLATVRGEAKRGEKSDYEQAYGILRAGAKKKMADEPPGWAAEHFQRTERTIEQYMLAAQIRRLTGHGPKADPGGYDTGPDLMQELGEEARARGFGDKGFGKYDNLWRLTPNARPIVGEGKMFAPGGAVHDIPAPAASPAHNPQSNAGTTINIMGDAYGFEFDPTKRPANNIMVGIG